MREGTGPHGWEREAGKEREEAGRPPCGDGETSCLVAFGRANVSHVKAEHLD